MMLATTRDIPTRRQGVWRLCAEASRDASISSYAAEPRLHQPIPAISTTHRPVGLVSIRIRTSSGCQDKTGSEDVVDLPRARRLVQHLDSSQ